MEGQIIEKRTNWSEDKVLLLIELKDETGLYDILRYHKGKVFIEHGDE